MKNYSVVYAVSRAGSIVGCRCREHKFHVQFRNVILTLSKDDFNEFTSLVIEAAERVESSDAFTDTARN
jgi:hypothetical protein